MSGRRDLKTHVPKISPKLDHALARARRVSMLNDRPPAPVTGRGIHCREGRLVGYGVKIELRKHHEACGLDACPCPCHHGGQP